MADKPIEAFEPATGELRQLTGGKLPMALSLRADGDRLWVAGHLPVNMRRPPTPPLMAPGMAGDAQGNVYFGTDQNAVYKVRPLW